MRRFILLAFIITSHAILAQESTELEKRNGFKDIKLGMMVDSIRGAKFKKDFKEKDEHDAKLYVVEHEDYKKIGEVDVNKIELKAYKGFVYEITVVAHKDPRLMKALESIYGRSEYDMKSEKYFWKAKSLSLTFKSHSKNQLEMVYHSLPVTNMMKEDKARKVEAIADDF